ncbi:hypothetical protein [Denitromonas sp.]|uniref:hypothetical protein n=1 Tax=Denitromonas sp. TaxID=2734609 RepID=UPI003A87B9E9
MSHLICPHCHGDVSRGAKVCRGCQAEIEYGAPPFAFLVVVAISAVLGFKTSETVSADLSFLGWVIGAGSFVLGAILLTKLFGNRVNFKRIYRTK